jgi:hypothetical protein
VARELAAVSAEDGPEAGPELRWEWEWEWWWCELLPPEYGNNNVSPEGREAEASLLSVRWC